MSYPAMLIERAQAQLYARAGQWECFATSAKSANKPVVSFDSTGATHWMAELWFEFGLSKNQKRLTEYSNWLMDNKKTYGHALPRLSELLDAVSEEPKLQWILDDKEMHDIWIAATYIPIPNKRWRAQHSVSKNIFLTYTAWIQEQPESTKIRQKEYLEKYSNEALLNQNLLYYAICAYAMPTKKQVHMAASAQNPIYDMPRLEEYYPGIKALYAVCESMGFTGNPLRDRLCQFMDNTAPIMEGAIPRNGFESH